ncbi:hypothetical protein Hanom_Chr04g00289361 [Helianthus anomalus]
MSLLVLSERVEQLFDLDENQVYDNEHHFLYMEQDSLWYLGTRHQQHSTYLYKLNLYFNAMG